MKNYILLFLLLTFGVQAQTLPSPSYNNTTTNTLKIKTSATVTTTPTLTTTEADGSQAKITPANLPISTATQTALNLKSNDTDVIHKNSLSEIKIGSLSLGVNNSHASDKWIALGTSVTHDNAYTVPMGNQLSLIVNNFGVSGSTSNNLASQYTNIPTLTSGNIDEYRLLSIEHGINDAAQSVPLATYRTNIENCILNAKGKGWTNDKILIINSNYCTSASVPGLQAYAEEAILVAKEQGVQYVDIYNYTKNNGGGSLLSDGIHPSTEGGKIYARGVTSLMYGGIEVTSALNTVNGLNVFGNLVTEKKLTVADRAQAHQVKIYHTAGEALSSLPALGSSSEKFIYTNANIYGLVADVLNTGTAYIQSQRTDGTVSSFPLSLQPKGGNIYFGTSTSIGSEKFQFSGNARFSSDSYINDIRVGRGGGAILSNAVIGVNSLINTNGSSSDNTAVGSNILTSLVSGARNSGIGAGALFKTTANSNTAVGAYSLYENVGGGGNSALGFQAGAYLTDGTTPNTTPNSSVYFGRETKALTATSTNEIVIGFQANGQGSNTAVLGNTSITKTQLRGDVYLPALVIESPPATSAGGHHFLTGNSSTGKTEKMPVTSVFQDITTGAGGTISNSIETSQSIKAKTLTVGIGELRFTDNSSTSVTGILLWLRENNRIGFRSSLTSNFTQFQNTDALTANSTATWQNKSGTVAYTSDIPLFYTDSTTVVLSSSTLTSTYPSATIGSEVHAISIIAGAMIYKKTATGWVQFPVTVTP